MSGWLDEFVDRWFVNLWMDEWINTIQYNTIQIRIIL